MFFGAIFFILGSRLFYLQVILADWYDYLLQEQHTQNTILEAQRWNIFVTDKSEKKIKLTENITLYNVFVDPEFARNKTAMLEELTPLVYYHLCKLYWFQQPDEIQCMQNVEIFTKKTLLPSRPDIFYYSSGVVSNNFYTFDWSWYNATYTQRLSEFDQKTAMTLIKQRLDEMIIRWNKEFNYLWFFENKQFLQALAAKNFNYISIVSENYVYVEYAKIWNTAKVKNELTTLLTTYWYDDIVDNMDSILSQQSNRYVRIIANANPLIAKTVQRLKNENYSKRKTQRAQKGYVYTEETSVPVLHGLWLESYVKRYYPYNDFMSHILGYVDRDGRAFYWVEEYFDDILAWRDGRIKWRSSSWMWNVWANEFEIEDVENGIDVYLTIDPSMQREIEKIARDYKVLLKADSVSVLVYDPFSGHIKSSVTYPNFNPNNYQDAFELQPLSLDYRYVIDDETTTDIPVYMKTWDVVTDITKKDERYKAIVPKYIFQNTYWPSVFVDKNISYPYDPWSIFKTITYGIWLDTKEINRFEFYEDPDNFIKIDSYTIKNASTKCQGTHTFLYAMEHSCNVGIVRIVQRITRYVFYNYLEKLWFGWLTNIELAWEDEWFVESVSTVSTARFLNNSFWLWLLVTPIQMAVAYWAMINNWELLKPTVIDKICNPNTEVCFQNSKKIVRQVFSPDITEKIASTLVEVANTEWNAEFVSISGYSLGWKSWTAALVYKWEYREWEWRTNGSYVWIITKDNPKYVVIVQVRRPRSSQRWWQTAWRVFKEVASFLVGHELINE